MGEEEEEGEDEIQLEEVAPPVVAAPPDGEKLDGSYSFRQDDLDFAEEDFHESGAFQHSFRKHQESSASQRSLKSEVFQTEDIRFYGRETELQALQEAVERISLEWMENPSEVAWIVGPLGIGKSALVKQASLGDKYSASNAIFWKAFVCRGTCEEHATASKPFPALTDCLNDLCFKLKSQGGKAVWKNRLEEALGGEGPLLATICPQLCPILDVQPMDRKLLMAFDANTPKRFERLLFAVRDLLKAVSEYHPLIMVVDNIHWADLDSLQMMQDLLSTRALQNFLLIGCHEPVEPEHPLEVMKQVIEERETRTTVIELGPLTNNGVQELLCHVFLEDDVTLPNFDGTERITDLAEIVFALTKGNPLWIMHLLRLLNDKKLLVYSDADMRWDWNRKKIKKEVKTWRETSPETFASLEGVIKARVEELPRKIKYVVTSMAALRLSYFNIAGLYPAVKAAYLKEKKHDKDCPIASQDELQFFIQKACEFGIMKKLAKAGYYKFSHDLVRDCAATVLPTKHKQDTISFVYIRMGAKLSSMCMEATGEDRERFKFLAVEQLNYSLASLDPTQRLKLPKLNLEAAEIAIQKTAFRTACEYLEAGIEVFPPHIRWQKEHYDTTFRLYLFLARMRLSSKRIDTAKALCEEVLGSPNVTVKDQIYTNQVLVVILMQQGEYREAQSRLKKYLGMLGEQFPEGPNLDVPSIIAREIKNIREILSKRKNAELLNPPKVKDKKALDIMMLFASFVEVSEKLPPNNYTTLGIIRMMHISLKAGFSRQYPLAFAHFSVILVKKQLIKEAHRVGQIAEKIARPSDFYGAPAVALFHWHVGHWRRTYRRSLEPVLKIYNAQVDSGDFHNVGFSIHTYIQYHLASGFDLESLSGNLALFDGMYDDYRLPDDWNVVMAYQATANLMAETAEPLFFFGDTQEQQDDKVQEMEGAGLVEALEYFYFLRCYVAFFFHEYEVMAECLEKLTNPTEGVWIPWRLFFECFLEVQSYRGLKGKKKRELQEAIEKKQNTLTDWFNAGNLNPSAMVSILEVEITIALEGGSKKLSAMRAEQLFKEAVTAAKKDGSTNLEAFASERAGMYFANAGVAGFASEYLQRAHQLYDEWHAVAKVIDLEQNYMEFLQIRDARKRPASAYVERNAAAHNADQHIGGGHGEIKSFSIKKIVRGTKKATKGFKTNKIKDIFNQKKEKAGPLYGRTKLPDDQSGDGVGIINEKVGDEEGKDDIDNEAPDEQTKKPKSFLGKLSSPTKKPKKKMGGLFGKSKKALPVGDVEEAESPPVENPQEEGEVIPPSGKTKKKKKKDSEEKTEAKSKKGKDKK